MANVNTATEGNNAKQIEIISCKRELHVINPNVPKRSEIRKAKLRRQKLIGCTCLGLAAATLIANVFTLGLFFLIPGLYLVFTREVLGND